MTQSLETEISSIVARFHLDQQGTEPRQVEAFHVGELVVVRSRDVFTPTERDLASTSEGRKLIQSARRDQRALTRREIEGKVSKALGQPVLRSFYDIDTRNGEQVEVYVLDRPYR